MIRIIETTTTETSGYSGVLTAVQSNLGDYDDYGYGKKKGGMFKKFITMPMKIASPKRFKKLMIKLPMKMLKVPLKMFKKKGKGKGEEPPLEVVQEPEATTTVPETPQAEEARIREEEEQKAAAEQGEEPSEGQEPVEEAATTEEAAPADEAAPAEETPSETAETAGFGIAITPIRRKRKITNIRGLGEQQQTSILPLISILAIGGILGYYTIKAK